MIWRASALSPSAHRRRILKPSVLKGARRKAAFRNFLDGRHDDPGWNFARSARASAARVLRARRIRPRCARHPAAGGAVPRPLRRGHPQAHVSDHRAGWRRILPAAGSHHSGVARLSRLARSRRDRRLLLSRPGVPLSQRSGFRISASRHRILRPRRQGGGRRGNAVAGAGSDGALRLAAARYSYWRCGAVCRA